MGLDIFFQKTKTAELKYYRKVNFLVKFFSDKYALENCKPIEITKEDVEELIDRCSEVLSNHSKAPELLPTIEGFFFGNTEYNDYYFQDVFDVYEYCKDYLMHEFDSLEENESITFSIWY